MLPLFYIEKEKGGRIRISICGGLNIHYPFPQQEKMPMNRASVLVSSGIHNKMPQT